MSQQKVMDASLVSTLYLVPEWITRLLEDYKYEVESSSSWCMKLLEEEGRKAVWNMCGVLGVDDNGVPAQSCRLLERYLFKHMHEFASMGVDDEEWEGFKRTLASRIPLLMATCVQLAAKMSSSAVQVSAALVRTCLLCKGVVFSVSDIIRSEFQVFSTLGFRVPLWTSLEAAQMMALEVGLPSSAMEGVALVVNIAEYRRDRLTASVRDVANLAATTSFSTGSLGTLHLAAGAVAASARYLGCGCPDPVPRLAHLTRAPSCYIKCVCDVIIADILVDDTQAAERTSQSRKRKGSPIAYTTFR